MPALPLPPSLAILPAPMVPQKLARAQQELQHTIDAFNEVLSDCTPEEILGAEVITEILADAQRRMEVLGDRMRKR